MTIVGGQSFCHLWFFPQANNLDVELLGQKLCNLLPNSPPEHICRFPVLLAGQALSCSYSLPAQGTGSFCGFFFFTFDIIWNLQKNCKTSTKNSPFTQIYRGLTFPICDSALLPHLFFFFFLEQFESKLHISWPFTLRYLTLCFPTTSCITAVQL